ncbi:transmembrane protein 127-like isoform X2 [Palaemon carinicauda]|uniref:transmembrane protein 127-like isoform X2 n=1 Tax=Palaemon carinicauda TaxID=392227 RepID=UPI0035B5B5E7
MPTRPVYAVEGVYPRRRPNVWRDSEKNLMSGVVSIIVIVVTCACISQPQWFRLDGGGCSTHTVGLYLFFHPGNFEPLKGTEIGPSASHVIYYTNGEELKFCVTPEIVAFMRLVIGLIFLMISSSLVQMLLDITGPSGRILKCIRKNAVAGIISGALSVSAVGISWLRPSHIFQEGDSAPLVEEWGGLEGLETFSIPPGGGPMVPHIPYMHNVEPPPPVEGHPPPPYTP